MIMGMNRDDVLGGLQDAGLTEYQAEAYLTLLGQGTSQAVEVARRCSVPAPRIYDVVEELEQRGYVETLDRDTLHVRACDPVEVIEDLHLRSERLSNVASEIEDRWEQTPLAEHDVNVTKRAGTVLDHAGELIGTAESSVDLALAESDFQRLAEELSGDVPEGATVRTSIHYDRTGDAVDSQLLRSVSTEIRTRSIPAPFLVIVDRGVACFAPTARHPEPYGMVINDDILTFILGWYFETCLWNVWWTSYRADGMGASYVSLEECVCDLYDLWYDGARITLDVEGRDTETGDSRHVAGPITDVRFSNHRLSGSSPKLSDLAGVLTVVLQAEDREWTIGGWGARAEDVEASRITVTGIEMPSYEDPFSPRGLFVF